MITIHFNRPNGESIAVHANEGENLMLLAKKQQIPEMIAQCGGQLMCATCHVYVDVDYLSLLSEQSEPEQDLLDFSDDVTAQSRLACQIKLDSRFDGLSVTFPENQN